MTSMSQPLFHFQSELLVEEDDTITWNYLYIWSEKEVVVHRPIRHHTAVIGFL